MKQKPLEDFLASKPPEARDRIKDAVISLNLRTDDPLFPLLLVLEDYLFKIQTLTEAEENHVKTVNCEIQASAEKIGDALEAQKKRIENLVTESVEKQLATAQTRLLKTTFHRIDERLNTTENRLETIFLEYENQFRTIVVQNKNRASIAIELELSNLVSETRKHVVHPVSKLLSSLAFWGVLGIGATAFAVFFIDLGTEFAIQGTNMQEIIREKLTNGL